MSIFKTLKSFFKVQREKMVQQRHSAAEADSHYSTTTKYKVYEVDGSIHEFRSLNELEHFIHTERHKEIETLQV